MTSLKIKPFETSDAQVCRSLRSKAFEELFSKEIGQDAARSGIETYAPEDIVLLAENNPFFVAVAQSEIVGYIGSKIHDENTVEILFLYVDLNFLRKGIGSGLLHHFEEYVIKNLPNIKTIIVDTVIPRYNQKFYEKMGYVKIGESFYNYPSGKVRAVRLEKKIVYV